MYSTENNKVIAHILWNGNRDYEHTVRNLVPLVPRDAVEHDELMDLLNYADCSLGGPAALQELTLRLYPDKLGVELLERWYKQGRPRVRDLSGIMLESHHRVTIAQFRHLIIEAQGVLA